MHEALRAATKTWHDYGRRFIWIRDKQGKEIRFRPNSAQMYIARKKTEAVVAGKKPWFLIPKARRMGVTTRESVVGFHRCHTRSGQHVASVAFRDEDVTAIFDDQARRFYEKLPDWFRPELKRSNARELLFRANGSRFYVVSGSAKGGGGGIRGGTVQRVHVTEAAYAPKGLDMDDIMAGYTLAASHGDVTMESTGNGPSGWFYDECMRALTGKGAWSVIFAPWFLLEEYREDLDGKEIVAGVPHCEEVSEVVRDEVEFTERTRRDWGIEITAEQLLWRRLRKVELARGRKFLDQFPETIHDCFQAASGCFFDTETCLRMRSLCLEPISSDYGDGWSWSVWHRPQEGVRYIAAMDIAEGVEGGDWTCLSIHRRDTMEQVAEWHGHVRPKDAARIAADKCIEYNRSELAPERNNHGITVVDELLALRYSGLYYHTDGKPGWKTDAQTRPAMLDTLVDCIDSSEPLRMNSRAFWDECIGFRRNASGKYEGSPDDRVMTAAIAAETRQRAAIPRIRTWQPEEDSRAA